MNTTQNTNNSIPQFSFFRRPVYNKTPYKQITPFEINLYLTSDCAKFATQQLRSISDKKAATDFKRHEFNYACFSGTFIQRNETGLIKHSGLLSIDFDNITHTKELREKLLADPHLSTVLLFTSPSGTGLKWIIKIDTTKATHIENFLAIENYILQNYHTQIDKACKDVSRPCFLPYDPECYFNLEPETKYFDVKSWLPIEKKPEKITPHQHRTETTKTTGKQPTIDDIVNKIERQQIDLTGTYRDWLKMGFAFASEFNESGRGYFHRISRFNIDYNPMECDKQFDFCLKRKRGGAGIRSFFWAAKQAGIEI